MAYLDHRTHANQRAIIATVVALLQGAAIIAVINGLAVTFIPRDPEPPLAAEQWKLPPPPPPEVEPTEKPKPAETVLASPQPQLEVPKRPDLPVVGPFPLDGPIVEPPVIDWIDSPRPQPSPSLSPSPARPRNDPGLWATTNDYPASEIRAGHQGVVRFELAIGTDGRVASCRIIRSSGFHRLDAATCKHVSSRARFESATDGNGRRVAGSYSGSIRWVIPGD